MCQFTREREQRKRERKEKHSMCTCLISALSQLKQEDCVVQTNLDYRVKACLRNLKDTGTGGRDGEKEEKEMH